MLNTESGGQKCMHIPISTPIYWNYGIIHNFIKLLFGKVGFSGSKILLSSRWVCKWHITPPDLQVACLSNGIWLWYSQMSMRLLKARNTCSLSEILAISVRGPPVKLSFTSQEGQTMSGSLKLRFAVGVRSFKSKLKNKQCKWTAD